MPRKAVVVGALLVVVLLGGAATRAIPAIRRDRNERAALAELQRIAMDRSNARVSDRRDGLDYATLTELSTTQLVDAELGAGTKQGYLFAAAPSALTPEFLWFAVANPREPTGSGERSFCSNQSGVVHYTVDRFLALDTTDCTVAKGCVPVGR